MAAIVPETAAAKIRRALWPTCAVCNRPVLRFVQEEHLHDQTMCFIVMCHGKWERMKLTREFLEEHPEMEGGLAFVAGRDEIEAPRKMLP